MPNSEVHQSKGSSVCVHCGKAFSYKSLLEKHVRMHTGEKPFKCDICQKGYSRSDNLKQHKLQVHSGERPFECDVCHSTFAHRYKLVRHELTHTGERRFQCKTCPKTFSRRDHLQQHERTHRSQKIQYKTRHRFFSPNEKLNNNALECDRSGVSGNPSIAAASISKSHSSTRESVRIQASFELDLEENTVLSKCNQRKISPAESFDCEYCQVNFILEKYLCRHVLKHFGQL